jgi:hypothetical protein
MQGTFCALIASVVVVTALAPHTAHAGDPTQPHPHKGVLVRYVEPPPRVLSVDELTRLQKGEDLVHATADVVWSVISNFTSLPKHVEEVKAATVLGHAGDHTLVKMTVGSMGIMLDEYVDHDYHPATHWGTWTLDYSKRSDFDDSVGFWRVTNGPTPETAIVEYSAEVRAMSWAPGFVQDMINDKAMRTTPAWVKKWSETRTAP